MFKALLRHSYKTNQKARLKDLSEASESLYKKKTPFIPYQLINKMIRDIDISVHKEVFLFVNKKIKGGVISAIKQLLITSSPHLVQQSILHTHNSSKTLKFYLPNTFLKYLKKKGVNVNFQGSRLLFTKSVLNKYIESFKTFRTLMLNKDFLIEDKLEGFCSIHSGPEEILPQKKTNTFLNWLESEGPHKKFYSSYRFVGCKRPKISTQFDKPIHISPYDFPALTLKNKIIFCFQSLCLLMLSGVFLLGMRWQLAFLSKDILYYLYYKNLILEQKAKSYIFFCHNLGFRPLWTYQAENENRDVIVVFYASSYTLFIYSDMPLSKDLKLPYVQIASWSHYWVQGMGFKNTLSELLEAPAQIDVVGAFPFTDVGEKVPSLKENEILVFDVDPSRDYLEYTKHGYILPNFTDEIILKFWKDLYEVAKELNLCLVHKRKRRDPISSDDYADLLLTFQQDPSTYRMIQERINTYDLIKKNPHIISVSLPFTSTGELSKLLGVKGIYYNPMGTVHSEKVHSSGVTVIKGIESLKKFFFYKKIRG